jgi:hypothetical protein
MSRNFGFGLNLDLFSMILIIIGKTWKNQELFFHVLYCNITKETMQLIARLANLDLAIDATSKDYERFWELYKGELISVESLEVEGLMVSIGPELKNLSRSNAPPSKTLKKLSFEIALRMKKELREDAED